MLGVLGKTGIVLQLLEGIEKRKLCLDIYWKKRGVAQRMK